MNTEHKPPAHNPVWIVDESESVFGLAKIHAVLKCKVCNVRAPHPEIRPYVDFEIKGETRRTYTLKMQGETK